MTPLHCAAIGDLRIVEYLVNHKAEIMARDVLLEF